MTLNVDWEVVKSLALAVAPLVILFLVILARKEW